MPGNNVVVDANIYIDIMQGNFYFDQKIRSYDEVFTCPVVLSELYFGAYRSANPERNLAKVNQVLKDSQLLKIDDSTAHTFVAIKVALYAKGCPISENDMWIASTAMQHKFPLLTRDKHFKRIDGLSLS